MVKGFDDESNSSSKKKRIKKGQAKRSRYRRPSKKLKKACQEQANLIATRT